MYAMINHIIEGSIAHEAGLRKGDVLLSVNNNPIADVIDYMYYSKDDVLNIKIQRNEKTHAFKIKNKEQTSIGIELKPFKPKLCNNKCIFCFVSQLPRGMRKTLYVRDDDYRLSFLFGNYITLTNLSAKEKKRIISQKLSPLYVSVHATDREIRKKMLGNPNAPDILKEVRDLTVNKIKIHAQIVLCPGLNNGEVLVNTVKDLQKFYPYVASIAVVPVGLTKHKKQQMKRVGKEEALSVIESMKKLRQRFKKRHGDPIVYLADELYVKAGIPFPSLKDYGDLPQIENGVGLIPDFMSSMKRLKLPKKIEPRNVAVFTGVSFMPYLEEFVKKLRSIQGLNLDVFKVENRFFGPTVTVTGLLTGKDILKTVVGKTRAEYLLVPNVALREGSDVFLDNITLKDMEETLGLCVKAIEPTPEGLLRGITYGCKRED